MTREKKALIKKHHLKVRMILFKSGKTEPLPLKQERPQVD